MKRGIEVVHTFNSIWWLPDILSTHPSRADSYRNLLSIGPKATIGGLIKASNWREPEEKVVILPTPGGNTVVSS